MSLDLIGMRIDAVWAVYAFLTAATYVLVLITGKTKSRDTRRIILGIILVNFPAFISQGERALRNYFLETGYALNAYWMSENYKYLVVLMVPLVLGYTLHLYPWLSRLLPGKGWLIASALFALAVFMIPLLLVPEDKIRWLEPK